jgi:hypothetical protein
VVLGCLRTSTVIHPEPAELRAGLDDAAPGVPARRADSRANPYDVLRQIEQRFGSDDAHANDDRSGRDRAFPEPWASLATEYEPASWAAASSEPIVCQGRLESSLMVARVLSWAARNDRITGDVVIVSSDGDALYDPSADVSVAHDASAGLLHGTMLFRCIVECLLSRGLNVVHVRPEAATPVGAQKQIEALVQLLGYRGEYIPKNLFSTRAEPPGTEPSHSILIPGVAAVQFMAANSPYCDSAVVIPAECEAQYDVLASTIEGTSRRRDPVASFVAAGSFNQGSSEQPQGTDLVQLLRAIRVIDTALEQLDAIPGERYALKDGLIAVTCPPGQLADRRRRFWEARKDESIEQVLPTLLDDIGAMTVRRRDAYIRNLSLYRHVDIVTKRSLERFVATGSFCDGDSRGVSFPDDYLGIELPTRQERVGHLRSLIADLTDYPNYELLLVNDDELPDLRGSGWAVKLKGPKPEIAFFEAIRTRKRGRGGASRSPTPPGRLRSCR